jgi:hypothetical protein
MDKEGDGDMMNTFRVAANSLALLYKESVNQSRRSYSSGYEQALQDIWEFISLRNSGNMQSHISIPEILEFIQSKHSESKDAVNKKLTSSEQHQESSSISAAPSIEQFNPTFSHVLPVPSENLEHAGDTLKRRWGFQPQMNLDSSTFAEQTPKRHRIHSEHMSSD